MTDSIEHSRVEPVDSSQEDSKADTESDSVKVKDESPERSAAERTPDEAEENKKPEPPIEKKLDKDLLRKMSDLIKQLRPMTALMPISIQDGLEEIEEAANQELEDDSTAELYVSPFSSSIDCSSR